VRDAASFDRPSSLPEEYALRGVGVLGAFTTGAYLSV
jgi:hypothetical protein